MYYFEPIEEKHLEEIAGRLNFYVVNTTVTFHKKLLSADDLREKVYFDKPYYKSFLIRKKGCEEIIGYVLLHNGKYRKPTTILQKLMFF